MERKVRFKKGMAIVTAFCMIVGLISGMPGTAVEVKAAENNEPSVTTFATKEQLMREFTLGNENSALSKVGYVNFGKDDYGKVAKWYVLGADEGINGDNVVLFASSPLQSDVSFETSTGSRRYLSTYGTYTNKSPLWVYPSHYGASSIRKTLKNMEMNTFYFSLAEQKMMNSTTVEVTDAWNDRSTYTVQDKLYLADGDYASDYDDYVRFGTKNDLYVYGKNIKNIKNNFWLRSPYLLENDDDDLQYKALKAISGASYVVGSQDVRDGTCAIYPAFDLNLTSVLFASAVTAQSSNPDTPVTGTIDDEDGMNLRLDGSTMMTDEHIYYNESSITYAAKAGSVIMVQGNNDGKDWYYSKYVGWDVKNGVINLPEIQDTLLYGYGINESPNLSSCKIWIEKVTDGMTYAKMAKKCTEVSSVDVDIETPEAGKAFNTETTIDQEGVTGTVKWLNSDGTAVVTGQTAVCGASYTACVTLTPSEGYEFSNSINVSINGKSPAISKNSDGTVTATLNNSFKAKYKFQYSVNAYNGKYDGQPHTIAVNVEGAVSSTIYYSYIKDGSSYSTTSTTRPTYTDAGNYIVKYSIEADNYETVTGSETIIIAPRNISITTLDQDTIYGQNIEQTGYSVSGDGLATGENITGITLVTNLNSHALVGSIGKISATGVSIGNGAKDTTANYSIDCNNSGTHTIIHDTTLTPTDVQISKTQLEYNVNDILTTEDISVVACYADGYSELITNFTTNVAELDMTKGGTKALVVEYGRFSQQFEITVHDVPTIKSHPSSQTISAGQTAYFAVTAESTTSMKYQWQLNSGNGWTSIYGATSNQYSTSTMYANASGYRYRCVITNNVGSVTSEEAVLTVIPYPAEITAQSGTTTDTVINVSKYFTIESEYGQAVYSIVGGTGKGTLSGTTLTVMELGTFEIQLSTTASGIYAAGSAKATITVKGKEAIVHTAESYSGVYDGLEHSINLKVITPAEVTITYSTDDKTYSTEKPVFVDAGEYTVYYRIKADGYEDAAGYKRVTISQREITVTAQDQTIMWSNDLDQTKYVVSGAGLVTGHRIAAIILTPSTERITTTGGISVSGIKVEDSEGVNQTANYKITRVSGNLTVVHNTTLSAQSIEVTKTKLVYQVGEKLTTDDIKVKAVYKDGYSEVVTDFTTNVSEIDMSKSGAKTLIVRYTINGKTTSKNLTITVNQQLVITANPIDVEIRAGKKATFMVTAQGDGPLTYQWMVNKGKSWTKVSDATKSVYTTDVMNVEANGYVYKCLVANATELIESEEAVLTVNPIPVDIEPWESDVVTENSVDVSEYFLMDENAGAATYTLVEGEGTGKGTLSGTTLTVTQSGTFVIHVATAASGNYAKGEATVTVTITREESVEYTAENYEGVYDGQPHNISIEIESPAETIVTYSTDETEEKEYSEDEPEFTDVGEYIVYYKIEGVDVKTVTGSGKVTIVEREITITADDQTVTIDGGLNADDFDDSGYRITKGELAEGHSIEEITLTPSISLTSSEIMIDDAVIVDEEEEDVTDNYDITYVNGDLILNSVVPDEPDEPDDPIGTDPNTDDFMDIDWETTEDEEDWDEEDWDEEDWDEEDWEDLEVYNGDARYKVVVNDDDDVEVTYMAPKKKTLLEVTIPNTVTLSDGTNAKVTAIAPKAFKNNKKLTKIVIGKNITSIGKFAFSGCKNLKSISIKTKKLKEKSVGSKAFKGTPADVVVKVPKTKIKTYTTILKEKGIGKKAVIKK